MPEGHDVFGSSAFAKLTVSFAKRLSKSKNSMNHGKSNVNVEVLMSGEKKHGAESKCNAQSSHHGMDNKSSTKTL